MFILVYFEFLINLLPQVDIYLDSFFFEFFDPILLMYDDFDYQIKNSANVLSNSLFEHFLSNIKKVSKMQSIIKHMVKKIPEYRNTANRILILKWIYMIDSFPGSSLTFILELFISDYLYLFLDPN